MRIEFDFRDLEAFLVVAELGSFLGAAARLSVSQPTLTRRIQKLESALGATLFERTTRSNKLTLAGKGFRSRAQSMLDSAHEAMLALSNELTHAQEQSRAVVTLAVIPTATPRILPRAISTFRAAGYVARIRVLDADANGVAELVATGEADFGVSFIPAEEPGLTFQPLMNDRFVLAMLRADVLAARSEISWAEVDPGRFIVPVKGTGNRMLIDEALARAHQTLRWGYEVARSTTHLSLVEAGVGVAALPESALSGSAQARVVSIPLVHPIVSRAVGTIRRTSHVLTPAADAFNKILEHALVDLSVR